MERYRIQKQQIMNDGTLVNNSVVYDETIAESMWDIIHLSIRCQGFDVHKEESENVTLFKNDEGYIQLSMKLVD